MVTVVVRELGPLLAALMALARAGTANVVELGTARAQGEVEALQRWESIPFTTWWRPAWEWRRPFSR